jgi:Zn finger protein HypA/HybF involved in hydrogenase expression
MEDFMKLHKRKYQFICPKHGFLKREDVAFLCNRCDRYQLVRKDGLYMCPGCLEPKDENFMCLICDSKDVKMIKTKRN